MNCGVLQLDPLAFLHVEMGGEPRIGAIPVLAHLHEIRLHLHFSAATGARESFLPVLELEERCVVRSVERATNVVMKPRLDPPVNRVSCLLALR